MAVHTVLGVFVLDNVWGVFFWTRFRHESPTIRPQGKAGRITDGVHAVRTRPRCDGSGRAARSSGCACETRDQLAVEWHVHARAVAGWQAGEAQHAEEPEQKLAAVQGKGKEADPEQAGEQQQLVVAAQPSQAPTTPLPPLGQQRVARACHGGVRCGARGKNWKGRRKTLTH